MTSTKSLKTSPSYNKYKIKNKINVYENFDNNYFSKNFY